MPRKTKTSPQRHRDTEKASSFGFSLTDFLCDSVVN